MSKAPVGHTCPDIDDMISKLKDACGNCEDAVTSIDRGNYDDAKQDLRSAIWILEDFKGKYKNPLEDLRKSNAELREWGEEMANRVAELEEEIEI